MIRKKHILIFALLVFLALLFWSSTSLQKLFFGSVLVASDYTAVHPILGSLIFIALAAISAMFSFFSSAALAPIAILIWGQSLTSVLLFAGWIIGDIISYLIGFYAIHDLFEKIIPFEKINNYRGKISKKTEFGLIMLFRFAVPSEITGYLLGIIKYHFGKYFLATILSELPFALIVVYASKALIEQSRTAFVGFIILAIAIASATLYFLRKKIKNSPIP